MLQSELLVLLQLLGEEAETLGDVSLLPLRSHTALSYDLGHSCKACLVASLTLTLYVQQPQFLLLLAALLSFGPEELPILSIDLLLLLPQLLFFEQHHPLLFIEDELSSVLCKFSSVRLQLLKFSFLFEEVLFFLMLLRDNLMQ